MNIDDCCDYGYIEDLTFESTKEWLEQILPKHEEYTYAVLRQNKDSYHDVEESFSNFFLFRLFPYLPDIEDCRYEVIRKYTSSNSEFGIERNRCIAFELAVRNKKNIEDIEKAIAYYLEYDDILKEFASNLERYGGQYVVTSTHDEPKPICKQMNELCILAKNLKLIPYKNYLKVNLFLHWGLNSIIYNIVDFCFYYENGYTHNIKEKINEEQELNFSYKTPAKLTESDDEAVERELMLNNVTVLHQKYSLPKGFRGSLTDGTAIFDELNSDKLKSELQNPSKIDNKIFHSFQYPQLETYSKITIEIELSSFKTNINKFLIDALDSLHNLDPKYSAEDTLLNIVTNTDETLYDIKFFIYDYFTYRLEQNKHLLEYELWEDALEITADAIDDLESDTQMLKATKDKKIDARFQQEFKKLRILNRLTKEAIYTDLALLLELKHATVKSYLLEISKKIETSI